MCVHGVPSPTFEGAFSLTPMLLFKDNVCPHFAVGDTEVQRGRMIGPRPQTAEWEPMARFVNSPACCLLFYSFSFRLQKGPCAPPALFASQFLGFLLAHPATLRRSVYLSLVSKLPITAAPACPLHVTASQGCTYPLLKLLPLLHFPGVAVNQKAFGSIYLGHHGVSEHVQHCLLEAQQKKRGS